MNTKLSSEKSLFVINQYLHFHFDGATANVPYYNNNRKGTRGGLRGALGKGSPRDIFDEVDIAVSRAKISPVIFSDESLKHFLVDNGIGIDCSGFAYYVLNAEYEARSFGSLDRHLKFPHARGAFGKLRAKMRPAENAGVATFAHSKNSRAVFLTEVRPADIIVMVNDGNNDREARDHILFIHQVDYQNFIPIALCYSHSVAWPSDGTYGHGVRQGTIEIVDSRKPLIEQKWIEHGKIGTRTANENYTFAHAATARTEIRRMLSL